MSTKEEEIRRFAEQLYTQLVHHFNDPNYAYALLMDDACFAEFPGLTAANLRNVLLGGTSTGSATIEEFVTARAEYETNFTHRSMSLFVVKSNMTAAQPELGYTRAGTEMMSIESMTKEVP
jgi:hypothetical protein